MQSLTMKYQEGFLSENSFCSFFPFVVFSRSRSTKFCLKFFSEVDIFSQIDHVVSRELNELSERLFA